MNDLKFTTAGDYMKKPPMLERFAAQSLVPYDGELIFSKEKFAELIVRECIGCCKEKERANLYGIREVEATIKEHFGVEE